MSTHRGLRVQGPFRLFRPGLLFILLGIGLSACGGGGGSDNPAPPAPPPPPPPGSGLPPLGAPVTIDIAAPQSIGAVRWPPGNTSSGGQGQPVAGAECLDPLPTTYQAYAHLSIFLNGERLMVAQRIGNVPTSPTADCNYNMHTHGDGSGLVHVLAGAQATFTLGQLFAVWGQPLSTNDVAGLTGLPVAVYVTDNGTVTQSAANWGDIELRSHRLITIQVGTAINEIPNYTWSGP